MALRYGGIKGEMKWKKSQNNVYCDHKKHLFLCWFFIIIVREDELKNVRATCAGLVKHPTIDKDKVKHSGIQVELNPDGAPLICLAWTFCRTTTRTIWQHWQQLPEKGLSVRGGNTLRTYLLYYVVQ
ncbi:hypothetical protein CBL_11308 [Carabus blaptoides fortunei]